MTAPSLDRIARRPSQAHLDRGRGNVDAIRDEHDANLQLQMQRTYFMSNRDKAQVGFLRTDTSRVEAALEAYGELNAALDDAVDELERAFARERQTAAASAAGEDDLRRAPVLGNRRGGR